MNNDSEEYGGEVVHFSYTDAAGKEIQLVASPANGEGPDEANWLVETQVRDPDSDEWETTLQKWAIDKPEVSE